MRKQLMLNRLFLLPVNAFYRVTGEIDYGR
jgi:hypothetical protein